MKIKTQEILNEGGFSLMEVIIALVILLVGLLGVFYTFTYAVGYNSGNSRRSQALQILQQEVEMLRCAKYTPVLIDQVLVGGEKTPKLITTQDGNVFSVIVVIDDDPFTNGIQIDNTKPLKEITVTVANESLSTLWQNSVPSKVVFRRVRSY